jgi:hypothetical protein
MAGFVFGVLGIFRLVRKMLSRAGTVDATAKVAAWASAVVYAANPNLIYMQSTAMGESLYLAFFIWAVVHFVEFTWQADMVKANRSLTRCGLCLVAACLTRYDGWFLAAVLVIAAAVVAFRRGHRPEDRAQKRSIPPPRLMLAKFILLAVIGPTLWLAYNAIVYRNPLEFANGPYSAKAIEQKTATVNPAQGSVTAAAWYFLKAAELNVSELTWLGRLWLALALLGSLITVFKGQGRVALLLWAPLLFYALSVAYGSVPIFLPTWWPFSNYNVRYGLQLLPVFAVFIPLAISFIVQYAIKIGQIAVSSERWPATATLLSVLVLSTASYALIWRAEPICYREAEINMHGRVALDRQLAGWIKSMPPESTLLMYLGAHVGALEQAGVPLRRDINEGNHRVWKQPLDPDGLWERALADPASYADYVVGFEGDPVWASAKEHGLSALVEIHTTGQPAAAIFLGRGHALPRGEVQTR